MHPFATASPSLPIPEDWMTDCAPPLEIDFGCHRGAFLLGMAALHPGRNFLGIEKQSDRVEKCNARAQRLGLSNALAVQGLGASALLSLPGRSVTVFHLSFPDPWPKRRHASRRVFQAGFLREVRRLLVEGGTLNMMTDNEPYFREMESLTERGWKRVDWDETRGRVETAFEKTFRRLGQSPFRMALQPLPGCVEQGFPEP